MWDSLWLHGTLATMTESTRDFGLLENAAIATRGNEIVWAGRMESLGANPHQLAHQVLSLRGRLVTPGLIDPHTHIVYAGSRWRDLVNWAAPGTMSAPPEKTGLMWTVRQTRSASEESLLAQTLFRARALLAEGVTTLESKTGYGLDLETEIRMARVSKAIGQELPLDVCSTFLGAHALAPEFAGRAGDYVNFLCRTVLPKLARLGLVDAVDVFCDERGFSKEHTRCVFRVADSYGLAKYIHADQYTAFGAGRLAAMEGARAVAHLEHTDPSVAREFAENGSVAVLLPSVAWVQESSLTPPIEALRRYDVPMALATNSNPGSSPCTSPTTVMNLACHLFGFTPVEALAGFTVAAARALGLEGSHGRLEPGLKADFAIWNAEHPAELASHLGGGLCHAVVKSGRLAHVNQCPNPTLHAFDI
jgi:imidazolonepropionase